MLARGFAGLIILLFLFVSVFPFIWVTATSVKPSPEIFGARTAFRLIAENPTLEHYKVVLEKGLLRSVLNSFIVSIVTTLYVIFVATLSAYLVSRFRFKGKTFLMAMILAVSMFPQMIIVGPIYNMFYSLGILNSYWVSLAYSSITLPTAVWIMVAHFKSIPLSLEEAARIDGAGALRTLTHIIFPLAAPGVFTTAIMTFIASWNEYLLTFTLNTDANYHTVPVGITALRTQFTILWGQIAAATVIVIIPTLAIVLLFQKQIISGITSGAVKE
ncbi:MAG TPA: carbohydrate ABC transporter permease [Clostridiaceae bacterium]|nr:carbohydrate ABC transporter permease [Clostridiaceae bacterium]